MLTDAPVGSEPEHPLSLVLLAGHGFGGDAACEQVVDHHLLVGPAGDLFDRVDDLGVELVPLVGGCDKQCDLERIQADTVDAIDAIQPHDGGLGVLAVLGFGLAERALPERFVTGSTEHAALDLLGTYLGGDVVLAEVGVGEHLDTDALGHDASFCL